MATIKIVLDQRRAKNDETFPVVLRIRHLDRFFDIKTNYCVPLKLFDNKKQLIVGDMDANFKIEELKEKYAKRIRTYLTENDNYIFEINDLKKFIEVGI